MDADARAKKQNLRVIISEIIMFITVVITVVILALLASGYWLSSDFKVERQGMLQIHSIPTGADLEIDGETSWLQRTNTSKVLSSGDHRIVLTKDGYDSWEKTITISEGLLYRVNYPRLFLLEREKTVYYELPDFVSATFSPNSNYLLIHNGTTSYTILRLNSDQPETTKLDLSNLKPTESTTESSSSIFSDSNFTLEWSGNDNLIATINDKKYKINWRSSEFSVIKESDKSDKSEEESKLPGKIFHFYDEMYSAFLENNIMNLYKKDLAGPNLIYTTELSFTPETIKIGGGGGFVFMQSGTKVAIFNMEIFKLIEWELDSSDYGWLDNSMVYTIKDGNLIVYDFDGQNRRVLSKNVTANLPVGITENKWLYYFSDNKIIRETVNN